MRHFKTTKHVLNSSVWKQLTQMHLTHMRLNTVYTTWIILQCTSAQNQCTSELEVHASQYV